jgi:hypothetical protein
MKPGDLVKMMAPYFSDVPRESLGFVIESYVSESLRQVQHLVMFPTGAEWYLEVYLGVVRSFTRKS